MFQSLSGAEIAARGGGRFAARRAGDPSITGSLSHHRLPPPPKRLTAGPSYDELRERALPMAEPGADGADD